MSLMTVALRFGTPPHMSGDMAQMLADIHRADPSQPRVLWHNIAESRELLKRVEASIKSLKGEIRKATIAIEETAPRMRPMGYTSRGPWDRCR